MTGPFFGLGIASSALRAAQTQVDVTNQNIANANTAGYSRQSATIVASTPFPQPVFSSSGIPGQMGTGVQVTAINRARDTFADYQMHGQLALQGQVDAHKDALSQVEATVNEPSTTGLSSTVTKYWAAWEEVVNSPSDSAVRANLVESGKAVADVFTSTVTQFKQQQRDLDQQVGVGVTSINTYAGQIASLNTQIAQVEGVGMHANDLRDQRDLVVDQLSSMVKITVNESSDGQMNINVGNHQLVDRDTVHSMTTGTGANGFAQIQWSAASATTSTGAPGAATVAAGSMTINGQSVTINAGNKTSAMNDINNTVLLQGPNGVTASLSSAGALILTANTPGSTGAIAITPSATATTLGLGTPATTTGVDAVSVNLGSGKLLGLVESRDNLLQERIDDINALASRVIESVNSVQVSGVGLDGKSGVNFFSGTDANDMAVDSRLTAVGGTDHVAAARLVADPTSASGYSFASGDNSNALALAGLQNVVTQRSAAVTATSFAPGDTLGTPGSSATVLGVDLSGAAPATTYTFSVTTSPLRVTVSDGTSIRPATVTVGLDTAVPPNSIINIDTGAGRISLSAANGTTLSNALSGLSGKTVTTQAGPATIGNQYAQQVAALGVESRSAQSQSTNQEVLVSHLDTQRQQTSGVSLDEETVNLMQYQKAYQAAARVISVMDGMLDTLINHTIL